jgi:hypothetical protein
VRQTLTHYIGSHKPKPLWLFASDHLSDFTPVKYACESYTG